MTTALSVVAVWLLLSACAAVPIGRWLRIGHHR